MAVGGVTSPGAGVDETARDLAACFHVLRELVHGSCRWLALEPRLDVKYALADQIHDDARSARAVSRRLHELRPPLDVNHPGPPLSALLDRVAAAPSADRYLRLAYGEIKPRLAATVEQRLAGIDPWQDEPSLRLFIELRHRQAYHLADAPAGPRGPAAVEPIPAEVTGGRPRRLALAAPIDAPAREDHVAVVVAAASVPPGAELIDRLASSAAAPGGPEAALVHALMHQRLCWAETAARSSHEHPELPAAFHLDMAKLTWDASRHAQCIERLLTESCAGHWGQHPVSLGDFRRLHRPQLKQRLAAMRDAAHERLRGRAALWSDEPTPRSAGGAVRQALDLLLADEQDHFECLVHWSDRMGSPGRHPGVPPQLSR